MGYDDPWEREIGGRILTIASARRERRAVEETLIPDEQLDDLGWEIFYWGVFRAWEPPGPHVWRWMATCGAGS
jgi:hypothetical protein